MKKLISDLLKDTDFELVQIEDSNGLVAKNSKLNLYYVVDFFSSIDDLKNRFYDVQKDYYTWMMEQKDGNIYRKNSYFIVFVQGVDDKDTKNTILELEESSVFFKKYVVLYSEAERIDIMDKCTNDSLISLINKHTYSSQMFNNFKVNNEKNFYSFLLKLIIKLPNISAEGIENQELQSIEQRIEKSLSNKKFEETDEFYQSFSVDEFEAFLDDLMSDEEVL